MTFQNYHMYRCDSNSDRMPERQGKLLIASASFVLFRYKSFMNKKRRQYKQNVREVRCLLCLWYLWRSLQTNQPPIWINFDKMGGSDFHGNKQVACVQIMMMLWQGNVFHITVSVLGNPLVINTCTTPHKRPVMPWRLLNWKYEDVAGDVFFYQINTTTF